MEFPMLRPGVHYDGRGGCHFRIWAPYHDRMNLHIVFPEEKTLEMEPEGRGYFTIFLGDVKPGTRYFFLPGNDASRPDPASHMQPEGVHGPSEVVDHLSFSWEDYSWKGRELKDYIIYEIHTGTFTTEGTFASIISHLDYLVDLGITALELMPVAQFPGGRNWGYDGAYPYAVQNTYGGPEGLKKLVNACHSKGLAVILDVVYNHLGPEGNYLGNFGPYFTEQYRTPWGEAINFDGPFSDAVRVFFILNALHWIDLYHMDALRIDAIHGIFDFSATHFLQEMGDAVHQFAERSGRNIYLIPESDLNDARVIKPVVLGGYGMDAQWNDDFHHALHVLLSGEKDGYYEDFGDVDDLIRAFREGFVYGGRYSKYRKRRHGNSSKDRPCGQFVVFSQNHDQIGNRLTGDRPSASWTLEKIKLAAATVIFSPYIPLIFMGEEYGETSPFQYFISHSDEALVKMVRMGRREEFNTFQWQGDIPDPQSTETFDRSKIHLGRSGEGWHNTLHAFYRTIIALRRDRPALAVVPRENVVVAGYEGMRVFSVVKRADPERMLCLYNFEEETKTLTLPVPPGSMEKIFATSDIQWGGPGEPAGTPFGTNEGDNFFTMNPCSMVIYRI